jgi:hypothetical protein
MRAGISVPDGHMHLLTAEARRELLGRGTSPVRPRRVADNNRLRQDAIDH